MSFPNPWDLLPTFSRPWLLLLLAAPIALLAWHWLRREGRLVVPYDYSRQPSGWGWRTLLAIAESVPALLLAVAIILLAGPLRFGEPQTKRSLTNIELCVDISGSMTAQFGDGSLYDGAMAAVDQFLTYRPGDAFGLTFFGSSVMHWTPLTSEVSAVRCAPPFMRPENVPYWFGGTEIAKALSACQKVLVQRQEGDRMIILITDGYSSDLSNGADVQLGEELSANGITVFAVVIGGVGVQPEISTITSMTNGEAFTADDPGVLENVFKRIDAMKEAQLEKSIAESLDDFEPYCLAGLGLLAFQALAAFGLRYTPW